MELKTLFKEYYDKVAFLEPREMANSKLVKSLGSDTPIPILIDDLIDEIKDYNQETFNYLNILKGMFYMIGLEPEFKYNTNYIKILKPNEEGAYYLKHLINHKFNQMNYYEAYIYANALYETYDKGELIRIKALENIYNELWEKNTSKDILQELIKYIINAYEQIIKEEELNSEANLGLAEIYKALGQYVKSRLYYERSLQGEKNEETKALIREEIEGIQNDALLEAANTYISYNNFEKALLQLNQIDDTFYNLSWVHYLKGVCYTHLKNYTLAEKYYREALQESHDNPSYFNDYAIFLANQGKIKRGIEILSQGLLSHPKDKKLYYNRGILYYHLKNYQAAKMDLEFVYNQEPTDELKNLLRFIEEKQKKL